MTSKTKKAGIASGVFVRVPSICRVDKYNLNDVPGMTLDDLADPALPWEVFFWTAR